MWVLWSHLICCVCGRMQGARYDYQSNWGELLSSVVCPVVVVMDLETREATVIYTTTLGDISGKTHEARWCVSI